MWVVETCAAIDVGFAHVDSVLLFVGSCRRLCPANKQGKRTFAPVMLDRLQRLGINKTDPDELTPEEVGVA